MSHLTKALDHQSSSAAPCAVELGMKVEIDDLRTKVESMRGVISQLASTVRRLVATDASLVHNERERLAEAVRTIDSKSGSGAVCSEESIYFDSIMRVPFDDQDYSYLDELFPEEEDCGNNAISMGIALPSQEPSPAVHVDQGSDGLSLPLASAALYAFIASQVNTPGSLFSQSGRFGLDGRDSSNSPCGQMR